MQAALGPPLQQQLDFAALMPSQLLRERRRAERGDGPLVDLEDDVVLEHKPAHARRPSIFELLHHMIPNLVSTQADPNAGILRHIYHAACVDARTSPKANVPLACFHGAVKGGRVRHIAAIGASNPVDRQKHEQVPHPDRKDCKHR
eukprot:745882-Hanusia_phi.AAC.2